MLLFSAIAAPMNALTLLSTALNLLSLNKSFLGCWPAGFSEPHYISLHLVSTHCSALGEQQNDATRSIHQSFRKHMSQTLHTVHTLSFPVGFGSRCCSTLFGSNVVPALIKFMCAGFVHLHPCFSVLRLDQRLHWRVRGSSISNLLSATISSRCAICVLWIHIRR